MNRRLLIILLSAFVIAAISTYIVWRMVGTRLNVAKPQSTTSIVAAAKDLKIGMILAPADLTSMQIVGQVPPGAIIDKKNAIGRGVVANIYSGEAILDNRLAPLGSGGGLAATIKEGMRACAIKVDEVVGVAGFVTPGMRVDVLVSGVPPNSNGNQDTQTKTLLQNIEVLSAGQDIQKDAEGKPQSVQVVNLLVTPEQAQILALASNQMKIQLVLRNPLDTSTVAVPDTAMTNLFGGPKAPAKVASTGPRKPKAAAPPPFTITVLNGTAKSEEKFVTPGGQQ
ncbi:MAG TPA: Flp pilus assembly protein CpaB [Terracidiphilus sp.]|jgi:pilus assembly protein CpaB|nr:Flp pilus assembly protein CpaB [Terracidiphilus sp.]HEX4283993.1 Flp pilus assembly protein CpaB [Terracidiphilus sp.]